MQENQTLEGRVKCERLTPETLVREIRVWGTENLGWRPCLRGGIWQKAEQKARLLQLPAVTQVQ